MTNYRSRPTALDVRIERGSGNDSVNIHVDSISRQLHARPVTIGRGALERMADSLIRGLETHAQYQDIPSLIALSKAGYEAFEILSSSNTDATAKWKRLFGAAKSLRHAVVRTHFEEDLTFPFALLCSRKPKTEKYEDIVDTFIGSRSVFINSMGLVLSRDFEAAFVAPAGPLSMLHAVDDQVPGIAHERANFRVLSGAVVQETGTHSGLIASWNDPDMAVVHFTSHHRFNEAQAQYELTLSGGDTFRSLTDRPGLRRLPPRLPFVFMNGCSSGIVSRGYPDNFVKSLCEGHSLGMLSTIHSIGGQQAATFAHTFYTNWLRGEFAVDALALAKSSLIFSAKDFSAITYEFWEMPEELRLFGSDDDDTDD